jgi:hypothetical protein
MIRIYSPYTFILLPVSVNESLAIEYKRLPHTIKYRDLALQVVGVSN